MLSGDNYVAQRSALVPYAPYLAYAFATDPSISQYPTEIGKLQSISDSNVDKGVVFSSYQTAANELGQSGAAAQLQSLGVHTLFYDSEGGMTPTSELDALGSTDPSTNSVAQFVAVAKQYGFHAVWMPVRSMLDQVSDGAVQVMMNAGLYGIGLQEQKMIEAACVDSRVSAVTTTVNRYHQLASAAGDDALWVAVQIMPSRCLNGDVYGAQYCGLTSSAQYAQCDQFISGIQSEISAVAIWASGSTDTSELVPLVQTLR